MKKVIFGLLSLLLITPVFAEDIKTLSFNNQITFENISNSTNLTYFLTNFNSIVGGIYDSWNPVFLSIYNTDGSVSFPNSFYSSVNTGYGYNIDINNSLFTQSDLGKITVSDKFGGWSLLSISKNGYSYNPDSLQLYFSRVSDSDYSGNNPLITWGHTLSSTGSRVFLNNNYIRIFYSDNFNPDSVTPGINNNISTPFNYELFTLNQNYLTTKNYNVNFPDNVKGTFYTPNYSYGFSFINSSTGYTWDTLKFYSVFPFFDINMNSTGFYNLPRWAYSDNFYMFRKNGLSAGSDFSDISIISKCNKSICGDSMYSDILYSHYSCNGLSINTGTNYINFKENCVLIDGGIVKNILPFTNSTGIISPVFNSNNFLNNIISYFNSPAVSIGMMITWPQDYAWGGFGNFYINSSNKLCYKVASFYRFNFSNFQDICYNIDSSSIIPDILFNFDNTVFPPEPLTTGKVVDVLDVLCKSALVKPAFCYNGGVDTIGTGLDGMWYVDLSGNLVYTIIGTDSNYLGSFDLIPNGSGGFDVVCTDDLFGCSLVNNVGFSGSSVGGSGYILSPLYYEKFFTETGYWGSCPYPYTDVNVGLRSKVLNKLGDKLGFDIFLPINCTIAAFVHGKNYKFLSDVNLGLNPLMGNIQNSDDPRVYLYRFFDFLLSFALFIFLLKIYHLLN